MVETGLLACHSVPAHLPVASLHSATLLAYTLAAVALILTLAAVVGLAALSGRGRATVERPGVRRWLRRVTGGTTIGLGLLAAREAV